MATTSPELYASGAGTGSSRAGAVALGVAAALGGAAAFVHRQKSQAERRNPPTGRFVHVDGVQLHYLDRGQGPALLYLHGNFLHTRELELSGLADLAAGRYRVIAFDRPGFGYSERPRRRLWTPANQAALLHRALRRLGVDQAIVVGHSWGSLVALAFALDYPEAVRSVVLAGGYYYPTFRLDAALFSPPAIPVLGDLMRHTLSPLIARAMWPGMVRLIFAPAEVPARFRDFPVWMALRPSQLRAAAEESAFMLPAAAALRRRIKDLRTPAMVVAGTADRYVDTEKESVRLHREFPSIDLRVIDGAGHMVHHTAARAVMDAIDATAAARGAG